MIQRIIGVYLCLSIARIVSLAFFGGTYVLFLQSHGLDLLQVNLVNAAYFATIMLCSVPAGALAIFASGVTAGAFSAGIV